MICWISARKNYLISGYKTNHSLRVTTASRLFQNGVPEQLIMERTGHRSTSGVRVYKRTSNDQKRELSDILNSPTMLCEKKLKLVSNESAEEASKENVPATTGPPAAEKPPTLPACFNLSGCTGITINFAAPPSN